MSQNRDFESKYDQGIYYPDGADSSYKLYLERKALGLEDDLDFDADDLDDLDFDADDLADLDFSDEEESEEEARKEIAECVNEIKEKYEGQPCFPNYMTLKKENPEQQWRYIEGLLKDYMDITPAVYFKEIGLVRSGSEKVRIIKK